MFPNGYKPGMMPTAHPALGSVLGAIHNVSPHPMAPQMIGALNDFLHAHTAMGPQMGQMGMGQQRMPMSNGVPTMAHLGPRLAMPGIPYGNAPQGPIGR